MGFYKNNAGRKSTLKCRQRRTQIPLKHVNGLFLFACIWMSLKAAIDWDKELNRCLSKIKTLIVLCFVGRSACQRGLQEKHPRVGAAGGGDFLADWPATFQLPHKVCGRSAVVAYRSYSMFVHQRWRSGTNFGRLCSLACCTLNRSGNISRSRCSES